jgi:hypothetical protein
MFAQASSDCNPALFNLGLHVETPQFTNASIASSNPLNKLVADVNLKKKYRVEIEGGYKPALFINLRDEVFKCQEMQAPAENFDEGNSELFSNQNFRGRL